MNRKCFHYSDDTNVYVEEEFEGFYSYYERVEEHGVFSSFTLGPFTTASEAKDACFYLRKRLNALDAKLKPRHEHDCEECTFLGHYEDDDLYFCEKYGRPTVIARHGDKPDDYISGLEFAEPYYNPLTEKTMLGHPGLARAKKLAQERGLLGAEI